jgi:hypothetical protein
LSREAAEDDEPGGLAAFFDDQRVIAEK